jgi:hypothetical protein
VASVNARSYSWNTFELARACTRSRSSEVLSAMDPPVNRLELPWRSAGAGAGRLAGAGAEYATVELAWRRVKVGCSNIVCTRTKYAKRACHVNWGRA